jgi:DNA-binding response OmpR family regulator
MVEKILVVEDELSLRETLEYNLTRQGYLVQVAVDGQKAIDLANQFQPDLILLDIMLPTMDGFEVCRILRKNTNTPILMLTARDDEIDRVIGLEIGADDYITKPFSMRELLARVKAHLRRIRIIREERDVAEILPGEILKFSNLTLDMIRHEVLLDGESLLLKPKEFELLVFLAHHQGQVLSRELIMERVWGWEFTGGSRTVDVHIRWVREKIEQDPSDPKRIITVHGIGYRFEG